MAGRLWCIHLLYQGKRQIINYIKNQKEHHKRETFYDEFKSLLTDNVIEFNEKYLL